MKRQERREQVLGCAIELFAEKGYHATTVDDIVTRAGVARGTFYLYFTDKRSIFDELLDLYIATIDERITRIDPALGLELCLDLTRQNIRRVLEISFEQRALTKILLSDAVGLDAEFDRKLLGFYQHVSSLLESALRDGQEMGVVRACDVSVNAVFILGALKELLYQVVMRERQVEVEACVEQFLAFLRGGILELAGA